MIKKCAIIIMFLTGIIKAFSEEYSLDARYVLMNIPKEYRVNSRIYRLSLHKEKRDAFMKAMNMIEPRMSTMAAKSQKKEIIQDAIDDGLTDMHSFHIENDHVKLNERDSAYFEYYNKYVTWHNVTFNRLYIITSNRNKQGMYDIKGVLTGNTSPLDNTILVNKTFNSRNELNNMPSRSSSRMKTMIEDLHSLIDNREVEDITNRNIIPSLYHEHEIKKGSLIISIMDGFDIYNVHELPQSITLDIQQQIIGPMPILNPQAKKSRKQSYIIEGIESGESDIPAFLKMNGNGLMNAQDHAFADYHESYLQWKDMLFTHAYIITKKDNSTIEGLILTESKYEPLGDNEAFNYAKQVYLSHELSKMTLGSNNGSLVDQLLKLLQDKKIKQVNP